MAKILRRLKIKRVSLVDRPASEPARVVLFKSEDFDKAPMGAGQRNELPDSAFAAVWTDAAGNKQRKLPFRHADGSVDLAHLRNALARLSQADMPAEVKARARAKLEAAARSAGVGDHAKKEEPTASDVHVDGLVGQGEKPKRRPMTKQEVKCPDCGKMVEPDAKGECPECGADLEDAMDSGKDEATEKLRSELREALAKRAEAERERDALKAELAKARLSPEDLEKAEFASLPETIRKRLEADREALKRANEALEKAEETREVAEYVSKAHGWAAKGLPVAAKTLGPILRRVAKLLNAEDAKELDRTFAALAEQTRVSGLFVEKGSPGHLVGSDSASERIHVMARERVEKGGGKTTLDQALADVARENPGLYDDYVRESRIRGRGNSSMDES